MMEYLNLLVPFTDEMIYIANDAPSDVNNNKIKGNNGLSEKDKITLLEHLKTGKLCGCCAGAAYDHITGERVYDDDNLFTDGRYYWDREAVYHFEKYDFELLPDFIDYILSKSK